MLNLRKARTTLRRDERGNTGIVFAFALVPVILLVGGAIDVGNVYTHQQRLQAAGDAAVLAANTMGEATEDQRTTIALKSFQANVTDTPALANLVPEITASGTTVSLKATTQIPTPFLSMMQLSSMTIHTNTRADAEVIDTSTTPGKICMLALDPNHSDGIHIQGTNQIRYPNCWAHTNSTMGTAINAAGNSGATAVGKGHCAVGGASVTTQYSPAVKTGCQHVPDPFAAVSAYHASQAYQANFALPSATGTCIGNNMNLKKGTFTLSPGRYCGGLELQAHAKVTLNPGVYIIDSGRLLVQSGSWIQGNNVVFYFTGPNARLELIGGGVINLQGRHSGSSYAGFLFIAHANANTNGKSNIQGGGIMNIEGMLYMPRQTIEVSGNGHVNANAKYFGMIAKNFYFRGNGEFHMNVHGSSSVVPDVMPTMPVEKRRNPYLNM